MVIRTVLPANTVVLLVETDYVGMDLWFAIVTNNDGVEVLDHTEAVAAQRKVVGTVASASITEVESLLAVEWWASISIRDRHL